ncbi:MAG: hypothetical protein WD275_07975 [Rhodothermales bacterium]
MGKAAILIVTATLLLGSMYAFGAKEEVKQADNRLAKHQYEILARNAALAGYNLAKQALSENFAGAASPISGTYEGSSFYVTITRAGAIAEIHATGTSTTGDGQDATFTVDANIEKETIVTIAEEAPPFMRYAVMSNEDLGLNGTVLTDLYVDGNEDNTLNANMHTNGDLTISGNSATVRGFGTYVGTASANPSSALTSTFRPYYNPTSDPVIQQVPAVEMPVFDLPEMVNSVTVDQTTGGDVDLSGTYDLGGTRDDPYVWNVQGNLSSAGGVTINGYVLFIVNGNATFTGNMLAGNSGYAGGDESSIGVYAAGTINMSGNSRIWGQLFAGTGASFLSGTPRVYGSVATLGAVTLSGAPKIYYRVPSPALTTVFEDPDIRLNLISYAEW